MEPWQLNKDEQSNLEVLNGKLQHVRDTVRGVVKQYHSGLMLQGEGGTSKSYTVLDELRQLKCGYIYHNSRITARGLVDALERNPTSIHLIEDAETLLDDKKSFGVLRSALWSQSNKRPIERQVTWSAFKTEIRFTFTGGLIVISNVALADTIPELRAIKTRITVLNIDVSNAEILALMKQICAAGYQFGQDYLSPAECWEVCSFIVEKLTALKRNLDIRLLTNGFRDYLQFKSGDSQNHWKVLLEGRMSERVAYKTRAEVKTEESRIAMEIYKMKITNPEKLKLWKERTGLSHMAYYRALKRK